MSQIRTGWTPAVEKRPWPFPEAIPIPTKIGDVKKLAKPAPAGPRPEPMPCRGERENVR